MTIEDFPVSYDELEPYYDRFEKLCGVSGRAGNLRGRIVPGGNVFEGPRQSEYPTGRWSRAWRARSWRRPPRISATTRSRARPAMRARSTPIPKD